MAKTMIALMNDNDGYALFYEFYYFGVQRIWVTQQSH